MILTICAIVGALAALGGTTYGIVKGEQSADKMDRQAAKAERSAENGKLRNEELAKKQMRRGAIELGKKFLEKKSAQRSIKHGPSACAGVTSGVNAGEAASDPRRNRNALV